MAAAHMNPSASPLIPSSSKKRKDPPESSTESTSTKRSKKDKIKKDRSASKSKKSKKAKKEDVEEVGSEFSVVKASLVVSIPPIFAANPRAGVEEMLDSMAMRYIPALQGVVLSHSDLTFVQKTALVQDDCPFARCDVSFDATVWSPKIGMRLSGRPNLFSPDHISLLVHRTFNVSIPRNHIPEDDYEFEYGPAENDPEFGADVIEDVPPSPSLTQEISTLNISSEEKPDLTVQSVGSWKRRLTGENIGGVDGIVDFTVIGYTIANQMISLIGSLQPGPFDPEHNNRVHLPTQDSSPAKPSITPARPEDHAENEDYDSDLPSNPFDEIRRRTEEAAQRRTEEAAAAKLKKKEERAKRKASKAPTETEEPKTKKHKKKKVKSEL